MTPGVIAVTVLALLLAATTNVWLNTAGRKVIASYLPASHIPSKTRGFLIITLLQLAALLLTVKDPLLAASIPLLPLLASLAWVDALTHKLPTRLIQMGAITLAVALVSTFVFSLLWQLLGPLRTATDLLLGVIGGILIWTFPLLIVHLAGFGLGRADVRLAPLLGGWLGAYSGGVAFVGLIIAFLIAGGIAAYKLITGQADFTSKIAFGPAMVVGAVVAWVFASGALRWL